MITSSSNSKLKNIVQLNKKSKVRREQGLYVVEGYKMYQEAPKQQIDQIYLSAHFAQEHPEIAKEYPNCEVVEDRVFFSISDTKTPQGILCLMKQQKYSLETALEKEFPFYIVLEDLQDPGNVGTIIRTAEGAGVDGVILSKNCVDIYNPKTIRSTMGSIYRVPFFLEDDMEMVMKRMKNKGVKTYAAHLLGEKNYDKEDFCGGAAILIGNEGNGLSQWMSDQADCLIKIPMCGKVESLNAAMAAGILMYEVARQRR